MPDDANGRIIVQTPTGERFSLTPELYAKAKRRAEILFLAFDSLGEALLLASTNDRCLARQVKPTDQTLLKKRMSQNWLRRRKIRKLLKEIEQLRSSPTSSDSPHS